MFKIQKEGGDATAASVTLWVNGDNVKLMLAVVYLVLCCFFCFLFFYFKLIIKKNNFTL